MRDNERNYEKGQRKMRKLAQKGSELRDNKISAKKSWDNGKKYIIYIYSIKKLNKRNLHNYDIRLTWNISSV